MDLRSVLNSSDTADRDRDRKPSKAPPTPQQQHRPIQPQPPPHPQSQQRSPAGYQYREYGSHPPPMQSPGGRPPSQEYPPQHHVPPHHPQQQPPPVQQQQPPPGASYPPQSPYQTPGPYPGRPAPPPLQPANSFHHDPRSPTGPPMPAPSPTAYRPSPTPTGAPSGTPGGYPFPQHPPPEMTSPSIRHQQYPPGGPGGPYQQPHQPQRQDSYQHGPGPYGPQHGGVPQTPPVATPGGSHSLIHQRSQSVQSTPTPTSAHSQQHYGTPFGHGSPVSATPQGLPNAEYPPRQPSQPPTPLGPPMSTLQRQSTGPLAYPPQQPPPQQREPPLQQPQPPLQQPPLAQQQPQQHSQPPPQPQSPYQKRMPSAHGPHPVQTQTSPPLAHAHRPPHVPVQQQQQQQQRSPAPAHRVHESPITENHVHRLSQHEREHSMSVSPKTRVPSLPSNADRSSFSRDMELPRPVHRPSVEPMAIDNERATTPAKRKLADRDLSPRELEHKEARPAPGDINGAHVPQKQTPPAPIKRERPSPTKPYPKRFIRREEPIWAKSVRILGKQLPSQPNFVLQKRIHSHLNGGKPDGIANKAKSGQTSPEVAKSQPNRASQAGPQMVPESGPQDLLGPWEASITGLKPYEEATRTIADFLFVNVANNPDFREIASLGIKFEIEAKLGKLIDKDTNQRVARHLLSEAVLADSGRTAFKSSMTEVHHKGFNDFLNAMVYETDPRNPGPKRVQILYKHRRETDRFFELTPDFQERLPGAMRHLLGRKNVRVRVTYDQRTQEVLAKIIKARVADIDLHLPTCQMDCRLSVNLEMDWEGPVEELEQMAASRGMERQPDRNKDRLSYTHGHYQIDLTQVTQKVGAGGARVDKEHELEIEVSPQVLIDQARRAMDGAPHRYSELVEGLIDNIRVLARKADDFNKAPPKP